MKLISSFNSLRSCLSTDWRELPSLALPRSDTPIAWWLSVGGALTQHLRQLGTVNVEVVSESVAHTSIDERLALEMPHSKRLWVREIFLLLDGEPAVAARSICLFADTLSTWKAVRSLGTQPLAQILYTQKIKRSPLHSTVLSSRHPLAQLANTRCHQANSVSKLYARRSVFTQTNGAPLLVSECFMPQFWQRLKMSHFSAIHSE